MTSVQKPLATKFNELEFKINEIGLKIKESQSEELNRQLKRSLFKSMEYRYKNKPIHNSKAMNCAITCLSKSLGLDLISDEELNPDMISVCGSTFVIDIVNTETDVTVTITGTDDIQVLPLLNEYLTNLLKEADLFGFEEATQLIAFVDKFASDHKLDLFQCLARLEKDLLFIYQQEHAFLGSVQTVIQSGHGYPTFYQQSIGPCITYFANSQALFDFENNEKELDETDSFLAKVTIIPSTEPIPFLPQSLTQSCFDPLHIPVLSAEQLQGLQMMPLQILGSVLQAFVTTSHSINASFALQLVPPIPVTKEIEMRILSSHLVNTAQKDFTDYEEYQGVTFESKYVFVINVVGECQVQGKDTVGFFANGSISKSKSIIANLYCIGY